MRFRLLPFLDTQKSLMPSKSKFNQKTVVRRPFLNSFSSLEGSGGGLMVNNPGGNATPAFCLKYNEVRERKVFAFFSSSFGRQTVFFSTSNLNPLLSFLSFFSPSLGLRQLPPAGHRRRRGLRLDSSHWDAPPSRPSLR